MARRLGNGYTIKQTGRVAGLEQIELIALAEYDEDGEGGALELGDRGVLCLTLKVEERDGGTNEVQSVAVTSASGGTFKLTFDGQQTAGINHNASAANVQSALEALSNIAPGDVVCAGGALSSAPVTVTFTGAYEGTNVPQMTVDDALLTGGGSEQAAVTTTTPGVAPTLDVTIQTSADGTTWRTLGTFTQATVAGEERKSFAGCDRFVRAIYDLGGTGAAATFSVRGDAK
jgi:hypothetical protein